MWHPKIILSAAIIACGVFAGVLSQDDLFGAYLTVLGGLMLCVPLTLIIGVLALGTALVKRRIGKALSYALIFGCSSIISLLACFETGNLIDTWKVEAVHSYVARAVPILDQIKKKEGAYPSKLPVALLGEPPELLRRYGDYTGTQDTFRFEYVDDPAGWAGGEGLLEFNSDEREWVNDR